MEQKRRQRVRSRLFPLPTFFSHSSAATLLPILLLLLISCQICPNISLENAAKSPGEPEGNAAISESAEAFVNNTMDNHAIATSKEDAVRLPPPPPLTSTEEDSSAMSAETLQALLSIGLSHLEENGTAGGGKGQQQGGGGGGKKRPKSKPPAELSCNAQEKSLCANARMCVHRENASDFECLCRRGYAGRFCQFSLFPRSCADALAFHAEEEFVGVEPAAVIAAASSASSSIVTSPSPPPPSLEPGVWQLDIDGSGPLPATHAECLAHGGVTLVANNAPADGFPVRSQALLEQHNHSSWFFPVSYKLFSPSHLRALIDRSETCQQSIRFDCVQSPLDFKSNLTWLEVAAREGQQFRQLGTQPFTCACRNKELYGCGRDELACYCDDPAEPSATDQATLRDKSAGVTAIYVKRPAANYVQLQPPPPPESVQRVQLGPLECSGEAGTSQNALVTLRSPTARLETGPFGSWRQLELDFRTWQPDIEQMLTGWAPEGQQIQLKVSLRAGHRIELTLSHQYLAAEEDDDSGVEEESAVEEEVADEHEELEQQREHEPKSGSKKKQRRKQQHERAIRRELSVSIASARPLNDLVWHRLLVEMFRSEVRFSIDRLHAFQPLTFPFPSATRFAVGGDEQGTGFVGCVGNFRVDQRLVDWRSQLELRAEDARVAGGCADLCADNQCQQGARCVEHFDTESHHCECRQPRIHYGQQCENNVNENTSVAFLGTGHLRFQDLPMSALHADVVFSARTDQRRALLLYEHDHLDNFVQIHLADEYRIVLTLNNLSRALSCAVEAGPGAAFNDMRWRQIVLERELDGPGSVAMHVDELSCQIGGTTRGGPILLNAEPMEEDEEKEMPKEEAEAGEQRVKSRRSSESASAEQLEDVILPPVPIGGSQPHRRPPFHVLFIGGLNSVVRSGRRFGRQADNKKQKQQQRRLPLYISDLPALRGCLRGLLIDGEKLDLRDAVAHGSANNPHLMGDGSRGGQQQPAVQPGCEQIQCEQLHCRNGGQCRVAWHSPNFAVHCDCSLSSYGGSNCSEEIGLAFTGHSSVLFDMAQPKRFSFLEESPRQTLAFAFATQTSPAGENGSDIGQQAKQLGLTTPAQQLATLYFEDGKELHLMLEGNGTFVAALFKQFSQDPVPSAVHYFSGDFADGHRHFVRAHFSARRPPLISVDGVRRRLAADLLRNEGLSLADVQLFFFGGLRDMEERNGQQQKSGEGEKGEDNSSNNSGESREKDQTKSETPEAPNVSTTPHSAEQQQETSSSTTAAAAAAEAEQPPRADNAESIMIADAMRDILARQATPTAAADSNGNATAGGLEESNGTATTPMNTAGQPAEGQLAAAANGERKMPLAAAKWPQRVQRFRGCISNVAIEFERESRSSSSPKPGADASGGGLRFVPFLYYLQEEELLHRSVRNDPLDIPEGRLAPASCGPFHVPMPSPPPVRDVQFPVWEAPFRSVPFADWDPETAENLEQKKDGKSGDDNQNEATAVWVVSLLLILLLLLGLCCCFCWRRLTAGRKGRSQSAEFFDGTANASETEQQKKPMLQGAPKKNGPAKAEQQQQPPVPPKLLLQRPLQSPPPPHLLISSKTSPPPVESPRVEQFPEPAEVRQQPKSILRPPGQRKGGAGHHPSLPDSPLTPGSQQAPSQSATSSSGTYFTANDHFPPSAGRSTTTTAATATAPGSSSEGPSSQSDNSSFVSLEQPQPPQARAEDSGDDDEAGEEDLMLIGRHFEEQAPELMDESTLELSNGGDGLLLHSASSSARGSASPAAGSRSSTTPFADRLPSPRRPDTTSPTHTLANNNSNGAEDGGSGSAAGVGRIVGEDGQQQPGHGEQPQEQQRQPATGKPADNVNG